MEKEKDSNLKLEEDPDIDERTGMPNESCFVGEFLAILLVAFFIVTILLLECLL